MPVQTRSKREMGNHMYRYMTQSERPPLLDSLREFKTHLAERPASVVQVFHRGREGYERAKNAVRASSLSGVCEGRGAAGGLPDWYAVDALSRANTIALGPRGGFAVAFRTPSGSLYVDTLCGRGDGADIMHRVRHEARTSGMTSVSLQSSPDAAGFYRRLGMRQNAGSYKFHWGV